MPQLLICGSFMPTLCRYLNCRNRANIFSQNIFCTEHFNEIPVIPCKHLGTPLFRGFCRNCFISNFPNDPLSFQMLYKNKIDALKHFIFSRFDGFVEKDANTLCLTINTLSIFITTNTNQTALPNSIIIVCDFGKIIKPNGTVINPMLWKRLICLESIVNQEIENAVLNNTCAKVVYVNTLLT